MGVGKGPLHGGANADVMRMLLEIGPDSPAKKAEEVVRKYKAKIRQHRHYIKEFGIDPPEIANWRFRSK